MQSIIITAAITIILCTLVFATYGQTFSEWWRQKKTKIKYLKKQAEALDVLEMVINKGNEKTEKGLDSIITLDISILDLDETYLRSLRRVKPVIRNNKDVQACYILATGAFHVCEQRLTRYTGSKWLTAEELEDITSEIHEAMDNIQLSLDLLLLSITDGVMQMEDDQRLQFAANEKMDIWECYAYILHHLRETDQLIALRAQESANDDYLKDFLR